MLNSKFLDGEIPSISSLKGNNFADDILKPTLHEPGVNYFLNHTLKNIHINKKKQYDTFLNIILLFVFIVILGVILVYKYNNKETVEQKKEKKQQQQEYIINKIKSLTKEKQKEQEILITKIPKFESDYELLHKKFYRV
jgi:large-conductance mechanosensitive channel|tara:strand:- start:246 stop:662 length:417 start_codon:yes stop_codon:yes gene_type:complete